ncbi:MAG: type II toxin-antitoxin system HigB family toxin [Anaerolineaceae bacterium]|nr:type II toxin-antitoxin system HigB family toxin [Anaerolineaceae bacterium]
MRIISRRRLVEFWEAHPDAEQPLRAWYTEAKKASWNSPAEIKAIYRSVSILPNNRVVFNIKGNTYRLIVVVEYSQGKMFIRFVGTHAEYDRIDATSI